MAEIFDIVITSLAGLAVLVNTLGLISVIRNYRRLRQRMFMFVISLTMANVIVGIAFLVDAISRMLDQQQSADTWNNQSYCDLKTRDWMIYTESFKCASIVLSTLNSIVLTYALHKRTTRMGRHREENSSSLNLNTEGATSLHLPAFDTMMRVLNFKSAAKESPAQFENFRNSLKRSSTESKTSSNDEEAPNQVEEEEETTTTATPTSKVQTRYYQKKKISKFASILVPGSSVHSRGSSRFGRASDTYIGRHSVSVVSIQASLCMLFFVWLFFVTMLIVPIIMRLYAGGEDGSIRSLVVCPQACNQTLSITALQQGKNADMKRNFDSTFHNTETVANQGEEERPLSNKSLQTTSRSLETKNPLTASCSGCSKSFYPLTKLQAASSALIVIATWLYMLYSSMRLLWLRKHSNNVFVRCSALWRFILLTTIFHLVGTLLYVVLCIVDVTGDVITKNLYPYSASTTSYSNMTSPHKVSLSIIDLNVSLYDQPNESLSDRVTSSNEFQTFCLLTSQTGICLFLSSIFLLLHCVFAPLFYLLRLLGIRRLATFL